MCCNPPSMSHMANRTPPSISNAPGGSASLPATALALEDSPAGVLAAKAARMTCIAIPPHELREDPRYCIADLQLDSIEQFSAETVATLASR